MRVLLVNWAPISRGTSLGGGVNGYVQALALELAAMGHQVGYLFSGQTYVPEPGGAIGPPEVRRLEPYGPVQVFEIVNSPVLSPGPCQFHDPAGEVSAPALEAELSRFVRVINPDVIHFHNIEGLSAGCLGAARGAGAGVFYSLHNYHTACPQAYLMREGRRPCTSFQGGRACETCVRARPCEEEITERASRYAAKFPPPPPAPPRAPAPIEPPPAPAARPMFSWGRRSASGAPATSPVPPPPAPPPHVVPLPGAGVDGESEPWPLRPAGLPVVSEPWFTPESDAWEPLSNDAEGPEPVEPGSAYGERRAAMMRALSACDAVFAVSRFVRDKFTALGVEARVLSILPIGTRMVELAAAQPELTIDPPGFERGRPIRLVFMGYHNYFKGLPMLLDSLELLTPEYLGRLDLSVFAQGVETIRPRIERLRGRLAGLGVWGEYAYHDIPAMLSGKDLGLVPSVWWDNGPQTVMEFLACRVPVLGAAVGGIPDLVTHGVNGLLHTGNDRYALARQLVEVVRRPQMLHALRAAIAPPRSIRSHAEELVAAYARRTPAPPEIVTRSRTAGPTAGPVVA